MKKFTLGFIGGGRITRIFLQAFRNKSIHLDNVAVYEPDAGTRQRLSKNYPEVRCADDPETVAMQELIILAVHPPAVMETLDIIKETIDSGSIVVSLAPKITMTRMAEVLPTRKIMRMIPNATSYSNDGYNPVSFSREFPMDEKKIVLDFFGILGQTFEVAEEKLEGYAIYSAMLPTYFWFQWKNLEELAVSTGFSEEEAEGMLKSSINKAVRLMYDSGLSYGEMVDLIPVKPIGDKEDEILNIYTSSLPKLYAKIKPDTLEKKK